MTETKLVVLPNGDAVRPEHVAAVRALPEYPADQYTSGVGPRVCVDVSGQHNGTIIIEFSSFAECQEQARSIIAAINGDEA